MKNKGNGKKIALAVASIVAIGGSLAGGFVAGTQNTENKYSVAMADQTTSLQETETNLQKAHENLQNAIKERDSLKAEMQNLKDNGRPEDSARISELEENIKSKDETISSLQEQVKDLEAQRHDELYKRFLHAMISSGQIFNFANYRIGLAEDPDGGEILCYDVQNQSIKALAYTTLKYAIEWKGSIYANVSGDEGDAFIKISMEDFSDEEILKENVFLGYRVIGSDSNGEECMVVGREDGSWVKTTQDGAYETFSSEAKAEDEMASGDDKVTVIYNSNDSQYHFYMFEDGEFKDYGLIGSSVTGNFRLDFNDNIYSFSNEDSQMLFNLQVKKFVKIENSYNFSFDSYNWGYYVANEGSHFNLIHYDTMTVEDLGLFSNGYGEVDDMYGRLDNLFVLIGQDDESLNLILIKQDGTHEVVKTFESGHSYTFESHYKDEESYQLNFKTDEGETETFTYSFVEE